MRSNLCISATLLLASVGPGLVSAQVCSGEASFNGSPARFFASGAFGSSSTYHGGLALGRSLLFGSVEAGMTTYARDETVDYRGAFGVQVPRHDDRIQLCPQLLVSLNVAKDVHGLGVDYKEMMAGGGIDAGYVVFRKGNTRIVPTMSFGLLGGRIKYSYSNGAHRTRDADAFGVLATGVGFGLNRQFTISPSVAFPFGLPGATTWYGVAFSVRMSKED